MSEMVKWGILGSGGIARRFAASCAQEPNCELVALWSPTQDHCEKFAAEYGMEAQSSAQELLARQDIDAIYIALPPASHAPYSLEAIEAGKAVLCEKPCALTAAEFSQVAKAALEHDRFYMEAMKPRFTPLYQLVRQRVSQGAIGEVSGVEASLVRKVDPSQARPWFTEPVGGGQALDMGVYGATYLAEYCSGDIKVHKASHLYRDEVDWQDSATMGIGTYGCTLTCDATQDLGCAATIFGNEGSIEISDITRPVRAVLHRQGGEDELLKAPLPGDDFSAQIQHFCSCFLSGAKESPLMGLNDSLREARILDALVSGFDRYAIAQELGDILGKDGVTLGEPMKDHTTFKIGGPADVYITPKSRGQLIDSVRLLRDKEVPFFVLGKGSDLLVSDAGYRGVMVDVSSGLLDVAHDGARLTCQAGVALADAAEMAAALSLSGLEFSCGIPGTVGGAVFMNAGAYDGCIADVLESAEVLFDDGHTETLAVKDLDLGYRTSRVKTGHLVVISATFRLTPADSGDIRSKMDDLTCRREEKQPLEMPSAGSTFKRPEGHFAGKLISEAGCQGARIGGAEVSPKHAGFVVNAHDATAREVKALIEHVQQQVLEHSGVTLEPEVRFVGPYTS